MDVGTLVNVDLARFDDGQETFSNVIDICRFSSPLESEFGNGRAIESGISGSQLSARKSYQDLQAGPRLVP